MTVGCLWDVMALLVRLLKPSTVPVKPRRLTLEKINHNDSIPTGGQQTALRRVDTVVRAEAIGPYESDPTGLSAWWIPLTGHHYAMSSITILATRLPMRTL